MTSCACKGSLSSSRLAVIVARVSDPLPPHLQIAADGLKGRVFEVSLADLQQVSLHLEQP